MLYNIEELIWDEWNTEHIKKHKVIVMEVEEVCCQPINSFKSYQGRLMTLVLMRKNKGIYYLITARDMSRRERKFINEK